MIMAPKRPAHAIDDAWRERVKRKLGELGWKRIDLARAVGCPPSVVTELLNGNASQSPYIPEIHVALGWTPPQAPLAEPATQALLDLWARLDALQKGKLLGRAEAMLEDSDSPGKKKH